MGTDAAAVAFDIWRWDRTGARLLFLTTTPVAPRRWHALHASPFGRGQFGVQGDGEGHVQPFPGFGMPTLDLHVLDCAAPAGSGDLMASLTLPLAPGFAGDA